jgi:3',5'-cyclic AMP phosphodiesterase CpdA
VPNRLLPVIATLLASCTSGNELGHLSADPNGEIPEVERVHYDAHLELDCGAARTSAAGKPALVRSPYLQKMQHDATSLMWVARDDAPGSVELELPGSDTTLHFDAKPDDAKPVLGHQFVANLAGLQPETTYCYRVLAPDRETWATGAFTTAPVPGSDATINFAVLGDLGKRSSDQYAVLAQLEEVRSDFVLLAGDIAYDNGSKQELEANVFGVYGDMMRELPFFAASGNHDYQTDDAAPFREAFGLFENGGSEGRERWYSFDWGRVHVTVLDTEKIGPAQIDWLDRDLASAEDRVRVVLLHKPPFSSGEHGSDPDSERLVPLFTKHGVDLVLAGHDHDYERTEPIDGVVYVVSGGGGRGTRPVGESDFTAYSAQVAHFVHVIVDRNAITLTAIDATGEPFDTVTIDAPAPAADRSR